jgi:hypothetical protein
LLTLATIFYLPSYAFSSAAHVYLACHPTLSLLPS